MAYSYQEFIGDGVTTTFNIPFTYVKASEVIVYVAGVQVTNFQFTTSSTLTLASAPNSGDVVRIGRITDLQNRAVDFVSGAVLSEEDLDTALIQVFNGAQEAVDKSNEALFKTPDGKWDAQSRVIKNVADPVDAGDAVNKGTIDFVYPNVSTVANSIANVNTVGAAIANVNTVAGNITNVNTVAGNNTNVSKVAAVDSKVTTVANNDANVTTVANNIASVNTTAGSITNVNTTAGSIGSVNTVATNIANVNAVAGNNTNVTAVATNANNINAAVTNAGNINAVVANATNINTVSANSANVTKVANIDTKVTTVANNDANVSTVAGISGNVTTVAGIAGNVTSVAGNASNINTVAGSIAAVNSAATNMAAILDAPNQASAAASSAVSAASSAATAAALLDNFDDRYLGAKTADPSLDNDGNALIEGALYFNTTDNVMKIFTASGWIAASSASVATLATFEFVATSGQTVFTGNDANGVSLSFTDPALMVTLNGVRLRPGDDYTTATGTTITLVSAATAGDELVVDAFGNFLVADTYSKAQTDALIGAVDLSSRVAKSGDTMTGSLTLKSDYMTYLVNSYYSSGWKYKENGTAWGIGNNFGGASGGVTIAVAPSNASGADAALSWSPAFNVSNGGDVGIGATSPSARLHVQGVTAQRELLVLEANGGVVNGAAVDIRRAGVSMGKVDADYWQGMRFYVTDGAGGASTERMKIDTAGRVTKPYQPMFLATAGAVAYTPSAGSVISMPTAVHNIGGHYNTAASRFNVPVAGVYLIYASLGFNASANTTMYSVTINGAARNYDIEYGSGGWHNTGTSLTLYLNAGDYVELKAVVGGYQLDAAQWARWGGYLLG